ncbi:TPA: type II toxin-antitoxin system RnlB family antitoxin [Clostridium botulinum]|nr:type II toxin-antitoxin system RnlB family antitoxin [Clostridium botulinum]
MKCSVLSCEYNRNNSCSNIDNLEISNCEEAIICRTYKQSIRNKRNHYDLVIYKDNISYDKIFVFIAKSYLGLSDSWEEIKKDIENIEKSNNSLVLIDLTLSNGIKDSNRYLKLFEYGKTNNLGKPSNYDKELIKYLKAKTCKYLKSNENLINSSILFEHQIKMIKKGIVI